MDLDVILCNHAEAAGEQASYLTPGGGVNMSFVAPTPPHVISVGLGIVIHVPWQLTNQPHVLTVTLRDADANPVTPWHPEGAPDPGPIQLKAPFNVGRPPFIPAGDEQTFALAMNFLKPAPARDRDLLVRARARRI